MSDLLGLVLDFAENLPPVAAAEEGFVNNYSVLGTSALHMEYFQRIGINALRHTLLFGDRPAPFVMELGPGEIELSHGQYRKYNEEKVPLQPVRHDA